MPRSGHSGIIVNNSILLIYGGVDNDKEILADIKSFDLSKLSVNYSIINILIFITRYIHLD